jgi:hypothetical protein
MTPWAIEQMNEPRKNEPMSRWSDEWKHTEAEVKEWAHELKDERMQ